MSTSVKVLRQHVNRDNIKRENIEWTPTRIILIVFNIDRWLFKYNVSWRSSIWHSFFLKIEFALTYLTLILLEIYYT